MSVMTCDRCGRPIDTDKDAECEVGGRLLCKLHRDTDHVSGMLAILRRYMAAYPAFRIKPVGAPGSEKRVEQENLIALEDDALDIIARATA